MWQSFWSHSPIFPTRASSVAGHVDALYFFLVAITAFFTVLIAALILLFAVRYRRERNPQATQVHGSTALELLWTGIPLGICMVIFVWSSAIYFMETRPPRGAMEVYAVGKQWMWKFQHIEGQREINELHVPLGRDVRMIMTSQDVIHSFYVPAFRIKADVLPGRYTSTWFHATQTGRFHLFCAEYCGTQHSGMIGEVVVMDPAEYERWAQTSVDGSLASTGEKTFQHYGCAMCHRTDMQGRGPNLVGLYDKPVLLDDGRTVTADESYIRESILEPGSKIASGFKNIMPSFQGQLSEEEVIGLVAYIKALGSGAANPPLPVSEPNHDIYPVAPKPEKSVAAPDKPSPQEPQLQQPGANPPAQKP
ncbi:MAG TPA: cytochrome c oxidase subunit II [Candidatus Acidoferrales bacterium]|nr:cytochrome c oxidase subunit II [Candidatus Acidoferrales bacterium]